MGAIFFSPGDSHTKVILFLLHMGLVGICPDYKIKCKIKMREIKIKQYFGDLNCAMDKIDRGGGNNKKNTS